MPRNPNKRRCQVPGCRNWAMRRRVHCRSHLDHILGSRGAGAPLGNLNNFRHGAYVNPLSHAHIKHITLQLAQDPDHCPQTFHDLIHDLYQRAGSEPTVPPILKTVLALQAIVECLIEPLADQLFSAEVKDMLDLVPDAEHAELQAALWKILLPYPPPIRLIILRRFKQKLRGSGQPQFNYRDLTDHLA